MNDATETPKGKPLPGDSEEFQTAQVRTPRLTPDAVLLEALGKVPDLSKMARLWFLSGRGSSGKTLLARWLGDQAALHGSLDRMVMCDFDVSNQALSGFFDGVNVPRSAQVGDGMALAKASMVHAMREKYGGIFDFGGGDMVLRSLALDVPYFADKLKGDGVAIVSVLLLNPATDDIATLTALDGVAFQPEHTLLVLNLGRAEGLHQFSRLRAQPAYKMALSRGAVEVAMPRLATEALALRLAAENIHFSDAAEQRVAEGSPARPTTLFEALAVRAWLKEMELAFKPVRSWLPWV